MEIKFHTIFKKKLKKVPPKIQEHFYERLELFVHDKFNRVINRQTANLMVTGVQNLALS